MKYILGEKDVRSIDGKEPLRRVSQYTGVTQRVRAENSDVPDTRAESLLRYKKVQPNELVINIMLDLYMGLAWTRNTANWNPF